MDRVFVITSYSIHYTKLYEGYHLGIQIHFNNARPGSLPDHYSIAEIARLAAERDGVRTRIEHVGAARAAERNGRARLV